MPLPTVQIPDNPTDQRLCLLRIDKNLKGEQRATQAAEYDCQMATVTGKLELRLVISTAKCDEDPELRLIPDDSRLNAGGIYVRRKDGVAHFWGTFSIRKPSGTTVFRGRIELFYKVGSHTAGRCEPCDPENHVEGWLVGEHSNGKESLRAMIAAKAAPPVKDSTNNTFAGKLTGVEVRPV